MTVASTPEAEQARRDKLSAIGCARVYRGKVVAGKRVWTEAQERTLREMWTRDAPIKQIAHEVGKSERAVKAMRLKLALPVRRVPGSPMESRVSVYVSAEQMETVRRRAQYYRRDVQGYLRMLMKRDGAL